MCRSEREVIVYVRVFVIVLSVLCALSLCVCNK
jgi:hypothetical protein